MAKVTGKASKDKSKALPSGSSVRKKYDRTKKGADPYRYGPASSGAKLRPRTTTKK